MKLSQGRLEQLMAYADGELSGTERIEVEALLSENEDARQFLVEIGHLGGFLRDGWQESPQAKMVATFDIADDVMKVIAAEKPASKPGEADAKPAVRSLEEARQKRAAGGGNGVKIGGAVLAFLAAAAAVAIFARQPAESPVAKNNPPSAVAPSGATDPTGGVEVEAVESPGSSVSVFHLPGASELSTSVVVWVEETGDKP